VRLVFVVRTEFANDGALVGGNWLFACDATTGLPAAIAQPARRLRHLHG
jgi:hypothetical protein